MSVKIEIDHCKAFLVDPDDEANIRKLLDLYGRLEIIGDVDGNNLLLIFHTTDGKDFAMSEKFDFIVWRIYDDLFDVVEQIEKWNS